MGLRELAALLEFIARLLDPTLALPYFAGEGTDHGKLKFSVAIEAYAQGAPYLLGGAFHPNALYM